MGGGRCRRGGRCGAAGPAAGRRRGHNSGKGGRRLRPPDVLWGEGAAGGADAAELPDLRLVGDVAIIPERVEEGCVLQTFYGGRALPAGRTLRSCRTCGWSATWP